MDINSLRVFDALHNLGISEEEYGDLGREQGHTEHSGLYIRCIKYGYSIGVSHDDGHRIVIKEIKKKFAVPCRVLFKTLVTLDELPEEVYTLHSIAQYKRLDADVKHKANNLEQLKDHICDRFVDDYPKELGAFYDDHHYNELHAYDETKRAEWSSLKTKLIEAQLKALFWLFNEDYTAFEKTVKVARNNIARIVKVFERHNRRLALIMKIEDFERKRGGVMYNPTWYERVKGSRLLIRCFKPKDQQYNYVDINREIYLPNGNDESTEIWLDDDLFEKTDYHELSVLSKRLNPPGEGRQWALMNADEFNKKQTVITVEVMSARRQHQEKQARENLARNIEKQFRKGKVVRQGITFTRNSIECQGVTVKSDKLGDYIMSNNVHLQREPDFRKIVEGFIIHILRFETVYSLSYDTSYECRFQGTESISIGNVDILIESRKNNILVNAHRIPKNDLIQVIFKALNFTNQEKFNEYLKYCSSVNLELQTALSNGGLSFELKIDPTNDNALAKKETMMVLSLPLKRENGKNYTTIAGKDYRISNLKALFDLGKSISSSRIGYSGGGYLQRTIKLLYKAINGITPAVIGELIKNGEQEYAKLKAKIEADNAVKSKKADEFVEQAVRLSKAKRLADGFLVRGLSGRVYSVNSKTLQVYERFAKGDKGGRYVCIVDMETNTSTEWGHKDALAKRLLMLSHDLKVASEIHTLNLGGDDACIFS